MYYTINNKPIKCVTLYIELVDPVYINEIESLWHDVKAFPSLYEHSHAPK